MTLINYFTSQTSFAQTLDFFFRIAAACLCGAIIGFERSKRFKEAGVRTHLIVACGAALIMIISKYGFVDLTDPEGVLYNGTRGADAARLAAQVVSGISFLGAGVIFRNGSTVKGLTTAAGLWATAGIGLACGAGMYAIAFFVTVIIAVSQIIMHRFTIGADSYETSNLKFIVKNTANPQFIMDQVAEWGGQIVQNRVIRLDSEKTEYDFTLKLRKNVSFSEFNDFLSEHDEITSGSNTPLK